MPSRITPDAKVHMLRFLLSRLNSPQKTKLKAFYSETRRLFIKSFLSYGSRELESLLRVVGVRSGDTVMLHSAFAMSGYRGSPKELVDVFLRSIGPSGNLLMVSLPYSTSTYDYLQQLKTFDVRKTPSRMGMISESFRRREGVLRSFHPTHPVLAFGPDADWIIADHDKCPCPCGPGSPFEKFSQLGGKVVFFNVPFVTLTLFHYLEHLVEQTLPFALYRGETFEVPSIDSTGKMSMIRTRVFSAEAVRRRRPMILMEELDKQHLVKRKRIGKSRVMCVSAVAAIECAEQMARAGKFFYDVT
jgi:aminoglycoside 3-N-acetyltransferase